MLPLEGAPTVDCGRSMQIAYVVEVQTRERASAIATPAVLGKAGRRGRLILVPLSLFVLASSLIQTAVVPALPSIQQELGISTSTAAWVLVVTVLVSSVTSPILGRLADMFGKRQILLVICTASAVGCIVAGSSTSLAVLLVGRALQGFGMGAFPVCLAVVRDELPASKRASAYGLIAAMWGVGAAVAFPLSGVVVDHSSYRSIFWIALGLFALAGIAIAALVPASPIRSPARIDWVGGALFMPGLGAALLGINRGVDWGWGAPRTLGLFAIGFVLLSLWVVWELRVRAPLTDLRLLGRRAVWSVNANTALTNFSMYTIFLVTPKLAQTARSDGLGFGASAAQAGVYLIPLALMQLLGSALLGPLISWIGSKRATIAGTAIVLGSLVVYGLTLGDRWGVLLAVSLTGLGIGFAAGAAAHQLSLVVPHGQAGEANAVMTMLKNVTGAVGATVVATILSAYGTVGGHTTHTGYTVVFVVSTAVVAVALLAARLMPDVRVGQRSETRVDVRDAPAPSAAGRSSSAA
jgi:MFS family permease